jgi:hypothetical protein
MERGSGAPALTRTLGLVGLLALASSPACPKAEHRGPFLSILTREGATTSSGPPPGSIALALGGLPHEELTRLRQSLEESTDAAVRRGAARLLDRVARAEDAQAPEPDPLHRALPDLPALTAAANVLGAPWSGPGLSVELGPDCDAAASRCVPLFAPAADRGDTLVRHGCALAWTLANAVLVRVPDGARAALLRSLQAAQTRPSGTIALVFGEPSGVLDEAELDLLREQARRARSRLAPDAPERPWLDALGAVRARWELPIALGDDEVLVIPRLSALARLGDFHSEVELPGAAL